MNPETIFCLNPACPAKGRVGEGNISVHSEIEGRCRCAVCGDTFSQRKGTIFYRLRTEPTVVILVLTLLAYGCPVQAAAKAFELDERTVKAWWQRAGVHCESFHQYTVGESQLDLQQVQADEIKVKTQGGSVWMAMAMMVSTRLWLGGALRGRRDKTLIRQLGQQIRTVALCRPLLLASDGFAAYVGVFERAFRSPPLHFGKPGRPQLIA